MAGGTLVALDSFLFGIPGVPPSTGEALAVAVVWSAALLVTVVAVRRLVLVRPVDRTVLHAIVAYHLVYGVGLGVWIRLTWIT